MCAYLDIDIESSYTESHGSRRLATSNLQVNYPISIHAPCDRLVLTREELSTTSIIVSQRIITLLRTMKGNPTGTFFFLAEHLVSMPRPLTADLLQKEVSSST
jgi:hypothetical protein